MTSNSKTVHLLCLKISKRFDHLQHGDYLREWSQLGLFSTNKLRHLTRRAWTFFGVNIKKLGLNVLQKRLIVLVSIPLLELNSDEPRTHHYFEGSNYMQPYQMSKFPPKEDGYIHLIKRLACTCRRQCKAQTNQPRKRNACLNSVSIFGGAHNLTSLSADSHLISNEMLCLQDKQSPMLNMLQ